MLRMIVTVPIIIYSDATLLANFGDASLWPGYLFSGLISEYVRLVPSSLSAQHFVYFPSVRNPMMTYCAVH